MTFHELLVTTQFGSMIATDTLMIIAGLILVEGVRGEVQYPVVETLVTQD